MSAVNNVTTSYVLANKHRPTRPDPTRLDKTILSRRVGWFKWGVHEWDYIKYDGEIKL